MGANQAWTRRRKNLQKHVIWCNYSRVCYSLHDPNATFTVTASLHKLNIGLPLLYHASWYNFHVVQLQRDRAPSHNNHNVTVHHHTTTTWLCTITQQLQRDCAPSHNNYNVTVHHHTTTTTWLCTITQRDCAPSHNNHNVTVHHHTTTTTWLCTITQQPQRDCAPLHNVTVHHYTTWLCTITQQPQRDYTITQSLRRLNFSLSATFALTVH